jgi:cytochrome bd ubiquinol oxidase subunit I
MEAHWYTNPAGAGASWNIVAWPDPAHQRNRWALAIPDALSLLETRSATGTVAGLSSFPRQDQPPILVPFYGFRLMVLIGFLLFFLAVWTAIVWARGLVREGRIGEHRRLLRAWMCSVPLGYLAVEAGWLTREEARQPWIIYHVLRTSDAYSNLPPAAVAASLGALFLVYTLLGVLFFVFARRILREGIVQS